MFYIRSELRFFRDITIYPYIFLCSGELNAPRIILRYVWASGVLNRVYSGRTQCERALVRASVKLSGYRFNTRKPETCFLAQNSHFLLCSFANFLFDIFVGDFKKFGYYSIWIRCIKLCYQFCQTMSGNWSKSKSH